MGQTWRASSVDERDRRDNWDTGLTCQWMRRRPTPVAMLYLCETVGMEVESTRNVQNVPSAVSLCAGDACAAASGPPSSSRNQNNPRRSVRFEVLLWH